MKDQLLQEQSTRQLGSSSGYSYLFGYDLAGNPTTFRGAGNLYNSNNQNTASGYTYDGNGSPTAYKGSTLAFDLEARLKQIGSSWTAGYTGDGLRAWKQNGSTRTYFLYDEMQPVVEMDASGNVTAVNTFGVNGLLSRRSGSTGTFYSLALMNCEPEVAVRNEVVCVLGRPFRAPTGTPDVEWLGYDPVYKSGTSYTLLTAVYCFPDGPLVDEAARLNGNGLFEAPDEAALFGLKYRELSASEAGPAEPLPLFDESFEVLAVGRRVGSRIEEEG